MATLKINCPECGNYLYFNYLNGVDRTYSCNECPVDVATFLDGKQKVCMCCGIVTKLESEIHTYIKLTEGRIELGKAKLKGGCKNETVKDK